MATERMMGYVKGEKYEKEMEEIAERVYEKTEDYREHARQKEEMFSHKSGIPMHFEQGHSMFRQHKHPKLM